MISAAGIFHEIKNDDDAFRFFLSVASKGEHQGGWENARIAALVGDPALARKVRRHGQDETKHGQLFLHLLKKRGLEPVEVPLDADYCMQLERRGIGLAHERLREERELAVEEILAYLAHSRVTEQRAAEEVDLMVRVFSADPQIGPVVRVIADDEVDHLSYCHEELLRFSAAGHSRRIRGMLRRYARAEIDVYRRTSLTFVREMSRLLGWGMLKRGVLLLGVHATWLVERLFTGRRLVTLRTPVRPGALGEDPRAGRAALGAGG